MLAGRVFVVSMLTMAVGAVYLGVVKHQPNNIGGGFLTFYLIGTAWLTVRRRDCETSRLDWVWLLIPLAIGSTGWANGLDAVRSGTGEKYGVPAGMHIFMGRCVCWRPRGTFACCCAAVFPELNASRGTSGVCVSVSSSRLDLFSWVRQTAH